MKIYYLIIVLLILPGAAWAAPQQQMPKMEECCPAEMLPPRYAMDERYPPKQKFGDIDPVHDNEIFWTFRADRLEHHVTDDEDKWVWEVDAWVGADYNKLYLKSEGEKIESGDVEHSTLDVLYSRNVHSFWDLQAGIRHDFEPLPTRTFAALGFQGLAPQWFEVDTTMYLSDDGDLSLDFEVEYEIMLTQRLILVPRLETTITAQSVPEYNIGQGLTGIETGARLRYDIHRKFGPYIGISWMRKYFETADLIEADGGNIESTAFVAGIRIWY